MERKEWIDGCRRLFARLVRAAVWADFTFPAGGRSGRQLGTCFDLLCREVVSVSGERLADFCICQAYTLSGYGTSYRRRWNVSHSFGEKAVRRYLCSGKGRRYHEDRWLESHGLSRPALAGMVIDRSRHPLDRFIYPEYEERTKRRLLSTEAGYVVCALSTLLWTPFSPSCGKCRRSGECRRRTEAIYPELFRLRCEAWLKKEARP